MSSHAFANALRWTCGECDLFFDTEKQYREHEMRRHCCAAKPPLGITPEKIWREAQDEARVRDLRAAMKRYLEADQTIPGAWLDELKRRT
jgi:hypothetical protein